MPKRPPLPRVSKLCDVHPRVHYCKNAMLVRLKDGLGRIAVQREGHYVRLALDHTLLAAARVESGTCRGSLKAGYGDIMSEESCAAVRDALNADFVSLDDSLPALAPLLGLFSSGTYLIADFELFPVKRSGSSFDYFWDAPEYDEEILFLYYCYGADCYDAPLYLFPSQPAAVMNPARLAAYTKRLKAAPDALRSVAFYLNGSVALLLDGHHKAAAAASLGINARTLVIFAVNEQDDTLAKAIKSEERIQLRHVTRYRDKAGPLMLCAGDDRLLARVHALETMPPAKENPLDEASPAPYTLFKAEDRAKWGRVPDEYRTNFARYPSETALRLGTSIPPDHIRKAMASLRAGVPPERSELDKEGPHALMGPRDKDDPFSIRSRLLAYLTLFPDSKWLSESDRRYLKWDKDDPYWTSADPQ